MPNPLIKSFASKSGKSTSEVESLWDKAKELASEEGHTEEYDYIVGILKSMLGLEESRVAQLSNTLMYFGKIQEAITKVYDIDEIPVDSYVRDPSKSLSLLKEIDDKLSQLSIRGYQVLGRSLYVYLEGYIDQSAFKLLSEGFKKNLILSIHPEGEEEISIRLL